MSTEPTEPTLLDPTRIYRTDEFRTLFGFGLTVLKEKIAAGVIPKPMLLAPPPSKARGWFGWQVNEYRKIVAAEQDDWRKAAQQTYVPEGGDPTKLSKSNKAKAKAVKRGTAKSEPSRRKLETPRKPRSSMRRATRKG